MRSIHFYLVLGFINTFLKGTRFFYLKRRLFNTIGVSVGNNTKIVAPFSIGKVAKLEIGENCYINKNFSIEGNGNVTIGNNCDIAPGVTILTGSHEIGSSSRRAGKGVSWSTSIGNGTWIGAKSTIMNGANIELGVIIGACSMVNKNCAKNSLYFGSPAQRIKGLGG